MNPTWPVAAFQLKVINDLKCNVSHSMVYRALTKAREVVSGKQEEEFGKVYDYGNEILKVMPNSTVNIMTEPSEFEVGGMRFKRMYVFLGPLKEGFLHGCRPIIGLDDCHLKTLFGGILLTAVTTDPNDGIYPLAWAQVEAENNGSWDWFLELLKNDLRIENTGAITFICDKQKGLVNALENIFPESEHRFCIMHLSKNLANECIRKLMWAAARSTTPYFFNKNMDHLKKAINKYEEMGLISMFKGIHNSCMYRIQKRFRKMGKKTGTWCPNAMKTLKKSILKASNASPIWNGGTKYLVTMSANGHEIVVDLEEKTCACRKWQLSGIPCFHACACIFFKQENPENYLHDCYRRSTFLDVYSHFIEPVNGEQYWEETTQIARPLPPTKRTQRGKPKKKRDTKKDEVKTREGDPTMLKRVGTSLRCSYCGEWGKIDQKKKEQEEGPTENTTISEIPQARKPIQCSYCKQIYHTRRGCQSKKLDEQTQEVPPKKRSAAEIAQRRGDVIEKLKKKAMDMQINSDSDF
ncbi:hypothetical protein AgCh_002087 [Apium graveolens]